MDNKVFYKFGKGLVGVLPLFTVGAVDKNPTHVMIATLFAGLFHALVYLIEKKYNIKGS